MPFSLNLSSSYLSQRDCKSRRLELTPSFIAASLAARVLWFREHWVTLQRKIRDCSGGGGGYFRTFWVGMCRWDPGNP